jgi:integrase/recombinase XerD
VRRAHLEIGVVDEFMRARHLRGSVSSSKNVRKTLRAFFRAVFSAGSASTLSVCDLTKWLRERRTRWPLHMVCMRAWLVESFLDWCHDRGVLRDNPFDDLHSQYGSRTAPIIRALVSDDPSTELKKLIPAPKFGSFLGKLMSDYVELMRAVGYKYDRNEAILLRFDRFLQRRPDLTGRPLEELAAAWEVESTTPSHICEVRAIGRMVSSAMHRLDPSVPILDGDIDAERRVHGHERRPHVFSDQDIDRLLRTALSFPSPNVPLRPLSLYTMLVLAYCAGLRRGEIARLKLGDVDFQGGAIDIKATKFFKHRKLPLAPGVMDAIRSYLAAREKAGAPTNSDSGVFWNARQYKKYSYAAIGDLLVQVLRRAGLKPERGRVGPRLHDLRHSMATHRVRNWYKEGINPESKLNYLSTFLGHKNINSTLVYLHSTPEILQEASDRFRKSGTGVVNALKEKP